MSPPVHAADMLVSSQTATDLINNNNNNINNNNNNDVDDEHCSQKPSLTTEELALLAKLEEANR